MNYMIVLKHWCFFRKKFSEITRLANEKYESKNNTVKLILRLKKGLKDFLGCKSKHIQFFPQKTTENTKNIDIDKAIVFKDRNYWHFKLGIIIPKKDTKNIKIIYNIGLRLIDNAKIILEILFKNGRVKEIFLIDINVKEDFLSFYEFIFMETMNALKSHNKYEHFKIHVHPELHEMIDEKLFTEFKEIKLYDNCLINIEGVNNLLKICKFIINMIDEDKEIKLKIEDYDGNINSFTIDKSSNVLETLSIEITQRFKKIYDSELL